MLSIFFNRHRNRLWLLLRECLLTQRWQEAANVMPALISQSRGTSHSILKCGLEIFFANPGGSNRMLENFVSLVIIVLMFSLLLSMQCLNCTINARARARYRNINFEAAPFQCFFKQIP